MTRVFLRPDAATIQANNGIGRVVHAQYKYLPQFDIELVGDEGRAEVIAGHTHDYGARDITVCHVHGLYWTGDPGSGEYGNWHREANARIIASVRRARAMTVPSEWVAEPFRRDMRMSPLVIGHGIEPAEWSPGVNGGYVLWGKNRGSDVCDPSWPWELARHGQSVTTTFEPANRDRPRSLTVTGELKSDAMRELLRGADVYLATTKETFGIQTLEAMACGVPVLGFDWGGTASLITHQEDGYLVRPGDVEGLLEGLAYIRANRARLSAGARATAQGYSWERVIGRYADLYHQLAQAPEPAGVAVVIPCHNYGAYLAQCIESVINQTYSVDEIIVVDDGSSDDSRQVAERYAPRVRLVAQSNQGVAAARNHGVSLTRQPFVVCLDADDLLDPRYIEACRAAMLSDRAVGLSWTGMTILRGNQQHTSNWGAGRFDWEWQAGAGVPPHTNVPTGAMFRRALWERSGGYRQVYAPGEDAAFYTHGLALGFTARAATDLPLFLYRDHGAGAHTRLAYASVDTWHPWMRDRAYPLAAPSDQVPDVRSYSDPKVSVIIPVGPGHGQFLPDALESLLGQSVRDWEVIVADDSAGILPEVLQRFPFARLLNSGGRGPGHARNIGLDAASAPLVLFLDADDQLAPGALAQLCRAYSEAGGRYVYGDWQPMGAGQPMREADYNPRAWLDFDNLGGKHSVTVLMATDDARRIRFEESLPAWEDWDFFTRCALEGVRGQRVSAVTLYVRQSSDGRTGKLFKSGADNDMIVAFKEKYGGAVMGGRCCGGNGAAAQAAKDAWNGVPPEQTGGLTIQRTTRGPAPVVIDPNVVQPVRMEFIGKRTGAVTYQGARGSGRTYRGGNNPVNRFHNVHPDDVAILEGGAEWRRVAPTLPDTLQVTAPVQVADAPKTSPAVTAEIAQPAAAPVAVAEAPAAEQVKVIQTADGPVTRRIGGRKAKNTPLKELPPLED